MSGSPLDVVNVLLPRSLVSPLDVVNVLLPRSLVSLLTTPLLTSINELLSFYSCAKPLA